MIGTSLGPYRILEKLGEGGMGQVFRAHDSRIGREVAIKVSAERFSERFEREARAIASLNHPNVCTLYDVGPDYLVMELVEGHAPKGPLPVKTALAYARQIADALDAAHEKGVVHRDLKPANIKIKDDGTVKVLDFGLAKLTSAESGETPVSLTHSPTMVGATLPGVILGTAPYMAPEQARGKAVDNRADIWAFGVVLYEMITGRRAFEGDDVSSILAAVIQSEPRWEGVPADVRRLLEGCLQKDPRKRLRDIGDLWTLLEEPRPPSSSAPARGGTAGWIAAGGLAVLVAIALWAPWRGEIRPAAQPIVRLNVDLGSDVSLVPLAIPTFSSLRISPDGTRLLYVASVSGGPSKLFTRRLDQEKATELAGSEGAQNPFFSPDSQWVGFWNGKGVSKVPVEGGTAVVLGTAPTMTGADWVADGNILVGTGSPSSTGLLRLPSSGGASAPMSTLSSGELFHMTPQLLPGGKSVLVTVSGTPPSQPNYSIEIISLADGRRTPLVRGGGSARYVDSGHLLYTKKNTLFAVPFDIERLETRGSTVPILDDVAYDPIASASQFDVSRTGTLVYRRSTGDLSTGTIQALDSAGAPHTLLTKANAYSGVPRVSPDGKRVAFTIQDGANQDVWVYDATRDVMTRLTFGGASYVAPIWSRDGRFVVFGALGAGLLWSRADGAGQPQVLHATGGVQLPTSFTPDGKRLVYFQPDGFPQLWSVAIENDGAGLKARTPERFLTTQFSDQDPAVSPDGRWIAYGSNESGNFEVYVRSFSSGGKAGAGKWLISNEGGALPIWAANGRDLLYRSGARIMAVGYTTTGDSFVAGKPHVWAASVPMAGGFDLTPDGSRIVFVAPSSAQAGDGREHTVVFVQNFFEDLRRRAPVSR